MTHEPRVFYGNFCQIAVTDIQDYGADQVRTMFQTQMEFIVRKVQFVLDVLGSGGKQSGNRPNNSLDNEQLVNV